MRDCYGLITLNGRVKVLGEEFLELEWRDPAEANRILALANRLMRREGNEKGAGLPWIIMSDRPEPTFVVKREEE